jgi:hypothetical protein
MRFCRIVLPEVRAIHRNLRVPRVYGVAYFVPAAPRATRSWIPSVLPAGRHVAIPNWAMNPRLVARLWQRAPTGLPAERLHQPERISKGVALRRLPRRRKRHHFGWL